MNRSPLFYPLNRGLDAEAGGIADLQTDVMRFMAILALCLVAIFALVQSIPLNSAPPEAAPPPPMPVEAAKLEPAKPVLQEPAPIPVNVAPVEELVIEETPIEEPVVEEPVATQAASAEPEGFTLRFADDSALTRLVARNEVGLYAIAPEKSLRMNVNRGAFSFWPASVPNEFHEMDKLTVPDDVRAALRRAYSAQSDDLKWGVTLPSSMQEQLNTYLSDARSGALIINADGKLRLEP
jgi:hypothetical protein